VQRDVHGRDEPSKVAPVLQPHELLGVLLKIGVVPITGPRFREVHVEDAWPLVADGIAGFVEPIFGVPLGGWYMNVPCISVVKRER
jgi:hypothetical protein